MRPSIHIGKVVSNADPSKGGGLKVQVDELVEGTSIDSEYIPPCFPFAGSGVGFFFVPAVGDQVQVEVEEDPERSVEHMGARWRAVLYNSVDKIPTEFQSDYPNRMGVKVGDLVLLFDQTKDIVSIVIPNGGKVTLGLEAASHAVVHGDTYNNQFDTYLNSEATYVSADSTLHTLRVAFLTALQGALTTWAALPPAAPVLGSVLVAFATAVQPTLAAYLVGAGTYVAAPVARNSAISVIRAAASSWLSTHVFSR